MSDSTPEDKERERREAREDEKRAASEAAGEVTVSGVEGLRVGAILQNKADPGKFMRVKRIHKDMDLAVLVPHEPGLNRHGRRSVVALRKRNPGFNRSGPENY